MEIVNDWIDSLKRIKIVLVNLGNVDFSYQGYNVLVPYMCCIECFDTKYD